jgi:hypothetical protein
MPDPTKAGLLRALGRVVRGLSMLFWGLGMTALVYVKMVQTETAETPAVEDFSPLTFAAALFLSALLWFGLDHLRDFQRQERIWQRALNRAQIFAVVDAGLAPFLFWWHQFPAVPLYAACAGLLLISSLLLLLQINCVLQRLCAMLPDETLRAETKLFTTFNIALLLLVFAGVAAYFLLSRMTFPPYLIGHWIEAVQASGVWLVLFMILLPLAMTLALIWKIKEVIFSSLLTEER